MLNILYNDPKNSRMLLYRMLSISYHDFMNNMLIGRFFLTKKVVPWYSIESKVTEYISNITSNPT